MDETFPKAQPALHEVPFDVLNPEDQEALDYYLRGGKRTANSLFQERERRSANPESKYFIQSILETKLTKTNELKLEDKLINFFQDTAPMSKQEGRLILEGAAERVEKASRARAGSREAAVKRVYESLFGNLLDASDDLRVLDSVMQEAENEPGAPDIDQVRSSKDVLGVIAKQLRARNFLWNGYWPAKNTEAYIERDKYWRGFVLSAARSAPDEDITRLYDFARNRTVRRIQYLARQSSVVENLDVVRNLMNQGKLPRLSLAELWRDKVQIEKVRPNEIQPAGNGVNFDAMIPKEARQEVKKHLRRQAEIAALENAQEDREFEKQAAINTLGEARRKTIDTKKLGYTALNSDEMTSPEYVEEFQNIARRAKELDQHQQPKSKRRHFFNRRRSVIGRAADTADSDKRVEDYYDGSLF